jgi:hypothetical protein
MIAGVVVLSPLGRSVQDDVRGAVERWRAGSSPGEMSADD